MSEPRHVTHHGPASSSAQRPGPLEARFGSAQRPDRSVTHARPPGASDELVEAVGLLGEAMEAMEDARGHLFSFHRLSGRADLTLQRAVEALRHADQAALATDVERTMVGRDVIAGRWSFELVEQYDEEYAVPFREAETHVRSQLGFAPHVHEAEMKYREQGGDTMSPDD